MDLLSRVEIDSKSLSHNISTLKKLSGKETFLCPCVKSNAYGHGLLVSSKIFSEFGADFLSVNSLNEANSIINNGIKTPIYILGYVPLSQIEDAMILGAQMVAYNRENISKMGMVFKKTGIKAKIHIKVETGNNRQGVRLEELSAFADFALENNVLINGISTHFANIEDSTDHSYAFEQFEKFLSATSILESKGISPKYKHCANSAATLLFENMRMTMIRPGIACYGMWPSTETKVSMNEKEIILKPALKWISQIAQIKNVPTGEFIGYGLSYKTSRPTKIAIIPVGYYDGYDRGLNGAYVLIKGQRAPIRGRICMNIIMADISDISGVCLEDEVVLIGKMGEETISAELFAKWANTINYEVTTRINENIPRIVV